MMRRLCLLLLFAACDHTYLIRHDEYRRFQHAPSTQIAAERAEDGQAVWLDARKIHIDKTSDWAVFAHGKRTRATAISGGILLAAGLATTIAGGVLWGRGANGCYSSDGFLDNLCTFPSEAALTTFSLGVTASITGGLVLAIGNFSRSEEHYRLSN
jgi:hypothetical protein